MFAFASLAVILTFHYELHFAKMSKWSLTGNLEKAGAKEYYVRKES